MLKWKGVEFESSTRSTPQFNSFARAFKAWIKKNLPQTAELVGFNKGHFYCSGFVRRGDKYVYFSISDVRHFPNEWYSHMLVRTAKHEKDYSGGFNQFTKLPDFTSAIGKLLEDKIL